MKTKTIFYPIVFLLSFLFLSCNGYLPAIYDANTPITAPFNDEHGKHFISIDYNFGGGYHQDEDNQLERLNYGYALASDWYKATIGGFSYFGKYSYSYPYTNYTSLSKATGDSSYWGIAPYADARAYIKPNKFILGAGMFTAIPFEFGEYLNLVGTSQPGYGLPLVTLYPFVTYNFSDATRLTFKSGIGFAMVMQNSFIFDFHSFSFYTTIGIHNVPKKNESYSFGIIYLVN